ncbi:MAG: hypothetical protein IKW63_05540 [Elusimicrobiaceae bacterium]|nr:hypothetical protein [Elusimicrobiaceae bacterium]
MKKISLMMFALLLVPSLLNAQAWPSVARADATQKKINQSAAKAIADIPKDVSRTWNDMTASFPGWGVLLDGTELGDLIDGTTAYEFEHSNFMITKRDRERAAKRMIDGILGYQKNGLPEDVLNRKAPENPFFSLIFYRTEASLEKFSHNRYYRGKSMKTPLLSMAEDIFFPEGWVELQDSDINVMLYFALEHARLADQRLMDRFKKDPFSEYSDVAAFGLTADTRRAYEYRDAMNACGGLESCREEFEKKYGQKKIAEYENLFEVREEWLHYKSQNPVFRLYTLSGSYETIQFLNKEEYERLAAFFLGQEPEEGWLFRYEEEKQFYVNPTPFNHNLSVISGREINVRISDNLEASILPENLDIRIYRPIPPFYDTLDAYWDYERPYLAKTMLVMDEHGYPQKVVNKATLRQVEADYESYKKYYPTYFKRYETGWYNTKTFSKINRWFNN